MESTHTKLQQLRTFYYAGDIKRALQLASSFSSLGEHKVAINRGYNALQYPDQYKEMGYVPEALVQAGVEALRERYRL